MRVRGSRWCLGLGLLLAAAWSGPAAALAAASAPEVAPGLEAAPGLSAAPGLNAASGPASQAGPDQRQIRAVVLLVVLDDPRPGKPAFSPALVDEVAAAMERVYQVEVRRLATRALPRSAFYAPRKRYRADALLEYLATQIPAGSRSGTRVVGLTTADISTSKGNFKDWGVFGLGELGGTAAMVSSHRLTRTARDAAQISWRVTNTAVHELGHVLGLDHCEEPNCVMLDAEGGIANTDASSGGPGPQCAAKLDRASPLRPADQL